MYMFCFAQYESESAGDSTFSKASFVSADSDATIDINHPKFWELIGVAKAKTQEEALAARNRKTVDRYTVSVSGSNKQHGCIHDVMRVCVVMRACPCVMFNITPFVCVRTLVNCMMATIARMKISIIRNHIWRMTRNERKRRNITRHGPRKVRVIA